MIALNLTLPNTVQQSCHILQPGVEWDAVQQITNCLEYYWSRILRYDGQSSNLSVKSMLDHQSKLCVMTVWDIALSYKLVSDNLESFYSQNKCKSRLIRIYLNRNAGSLFITRIWFLSACLRLMVRLHGTCIKNNCRLVEHSWQKNPSNNNPSEKARNQMSE